MKTVRPIILASMSPRRKELLEKAGIKFTVAESKLKEYFDLKLKPRKLVEKLSLEKANAVCKKHNKSIIIAADTLVACRGKILGKPRDKKDAKRILKLLNGKMHRIFTGFTIYDNQKKLFITKSEESKIYFNKVSNKEIDDYIASRKPFDKAGAYGIQELPKTFVRKIVGDYASIIGLPISALLKELKKLGIETS